MNSENLKIAITDLINDIDEDVEVLKNKEDEEISKNESNKKISLAISVIGIIILIILAISYYQFNVSLSTIFFIYIFLLALNPASGFREEIQKTNSAIISYNSRKYTLTVFKEKILKIIDKEK